MKNFKDKVVVITGAGSGIGQATAIEFAKLGAKLALNDYLLENLNETKALLDKIGTTYYLEGFDVSNKAAFFAFADNVKKNIGSADIIMNNAGIGTFNGTYLKIGIEGIEKLMSVNYWSVVYGTFAFTPQLLENKKEAAIINVSSADGLAGFPGKVDYCSAKAAVKGFNESIAYDLMETNIQMHSVHPGGVATNISKKGPAGSYENDPAHVAFDKAYLNATPTSMALAIIKGVRKNTFRILAGDKIHFLYFGILVLPFKWFMQFVIADYRKNNMEDLLKNAFIRYKQLK